MAFSTSREILFVSIYRGECLFMKKNCQTNHFCFCPLLEFFYSFFFFCIFLFLFVSFLLFSVAGFSESSPKVALLPKVTLLFKVLLSVLLTMSPLLD